MRLGILTFCFSMSPILPTVQLTRSSRVLPELGKRKVHLGAVSCFKQGIYRSILRTRTGNRMRGAAGSFFPGSHSLTGVDLRLETFLRLHPHHEDFPKRVFLSIALICASLQGNTMAEWRVFTNFRRCAAGGVLIVNISAPDLAGGSM